MALCVLRAHLSGALAAGGLVCAAHSSSVNCSAPAGVPRRFLDATHGDSRRAQERWEATERWRRNAHIDEMLRHPPLHFDLIKQHYPHYVVCRDSDGRPIVVEQLGGAHEIFKNLRAEGVGVNEVLLHQVFIHEWLWGNLTGERDVVGVEPTPKGAAVRVYDAAGLTMHDCYCSTVRAYFKAMSLIGDHYPERVAAVFIMNVPSWFAWAWNICAPFVPARTQKKLRICGANDGTCASALATLVGNNVDHLPRAYGGRCQGTLEASTEERQLRAFVARLQKSASKNR